MIIFTFVIASDSLVTCTRLFKTTLCVIGFILFVSNTFNIFVAYNKVDKIRQLTQYFKYKRAKCLYLRRKKESEFLKN